MLYRKDRHLFLHLRTDIQRATAGSLYELDMNAKIRDMKEDNPLVSVVTATLNCEDVVERTIASVISQDYGNIEYIIIDGGSTDATTSIVNKYSNSVAYAISEKDFGIYDAMNKGICLASPESGLITFLNAGDVFHDQSVISNIVKIAERTEAHVYGNIIKGGQLLRTPDKISEFTLATNMVCHQAIFFKTDVHRQYLYDARFTLCADYKLLIDLVRAGEPFCKGDLLVVDFDESGLSSQNRQEVTKEKRKIRRVYPKVWAYHWCKNIYRFMGPTKLV